MSDPKAYTADGSSRQDLIIELMIPRCIWQARSNYRVDDPQMRECVNNNTVIL